MNVRETSGSKLTSGDATNSKASLGSKSASNNKSKKETGGSSKNLNNSNKNSLVNKGLNKQAKSGGSGASNKSTPNKTASLVSSSTTNSSTASTGKSNKSSGNKNTTRTTATGKSKTSTTPNHSKGDPANSSVIIKEEACKVPKNPNKRLKKEKAHLKQEETQTNLQSNPSNHQTDLTATNIDHYQQVDSANFNSQTSMNPTSSMNSSSYSATSSSTQQPLLNQDGWYLKEIQNMMHGFGDCPNPNQESVRLIEQIVHQQVTCLLRLACDVAIQRQSKQIGLEDFLFLLRKDKVKLCRLLHHFSLKNMRNRMSSEQWTVEDQSSSVLDESGTLDAGCTLDFDEEELLNALISEQKTNQTQDSFYSTATVKQTATHSDPVLTSVATNNSSITTSNNNKATIFPKPAKRLKLCLDFLASIDQAGDLDRYLHEDQFFDELKHSRMLRIERITRFMSEKEYLNFYKARQTSFANLLQPNKFRDWLYNVPYNQLDTNEWPIKPNALAIEILQYFAYETVAIIVDLALLVKQDQQRTGSSDPVGRLISINSHSNAYPLLNSNGNLSFAGSTTNQMSGNYPSSLNKHTDLLNPGTSSSSFGNCSPSSLNASYNTSNLASSNPSFNQDKQKHKTTTLPSPFIFSSANTQTDFCPYFSIKPQEIREVVRRYMNCNPRGSLQSVLLFGNEQWSQPNIARSKVMCL